MKSVSYDTILQDLEIVLIKGNTMEIKFEWNTKKTLADDQKNGLEEEIKQKVAHHIKESTKQKIKLLVVSLFDEKAGHQLTGAAVSVINGEKIEIIKNIQINPGFSMEFVI